MTERGACDPLYRYYVEVEGQTVRLRSMTGATTQSAAGLVRPDGRINITVGQADDPVSVKGRLGATSGAGLWSAPARGCAGRWSAAKRGPPPAGWRGGAKPNKVAGERHSIPCQRTGPP